MRNPEMVLKNLENKPDEYVYERIYRNLFNEEFFYKAYAKLYAKEGNMTEGTDGKTIDGMSKDRINKIISSLKNESYKPNPVKRVNIPKKNGGSRPLGIPSVDDKLVQEVVREILNSIYDKNFEDTSHGFRENKSCHTALLHIQRNFTGSKWFIEGDIKGFFDNIDHEILISLLKKKIRDEKFIRLIRKFLKAGYMDNWMYHKTYSGTPQGGIISPILSNIYLNELDKYMKSYVNTFAKGKKRKANREYTNILYKARKFKEDNSKDWNKKSEEEKNEIIREYKRIRNKATAMSAGDEMDKEYKRLFYVRYADDFIVGVIGSKSDAITIKKDIKTFLENKLKLELSEEKTLITNTENKAKFLGYEITVRKESEGRKDKNGVMKRNSNGKVRLYVPKENWINKLKETKCLKINGDKWESVHRTYLINNDDLEILNVYNSEIRGLYNYYKLAENVSVLNKYHHIAKYSFLKTLGAKYRLSVAKVYRKFDINGSLGVKYKTKNGKEKVAYFYKDGFKKDVNVKKLHVDEKENSLIEFTGRTSLIERLLADKCEWCNKTEIPIEIHHVRKLKDLKGKARWEKLMIARKRKTMALCFECHRKLHSGKLD